MWAKILAGVVASVLVAVTGTYVAFSGDSPLSQPGVTSIPSSSPCCPTQTRLMTCTTAATVECESANPSDALAACAGSAAFATSTQEQAGGCCQE